MRLGLIGRGPWGEVYARTLRAMEIDFWQAGLDVSPLDEADGIIIASAAKSHAYLAELYLGMGIPTLIEKPVALRADDARMLLETARSNNGIAFVSHTRLYSTAWRAFKAKLIAHGVRSVRAVAGGPCKIAPHWDWGPHLVAMCLDIGFDPLAANITTSREEHPLTFIVNSEHVYLDDPAENPRPLQVLLTEFMEAIEKGATDTRGLELGVKVVEALEEMAQLEEVWR